jgi:GAF domain-containing protein
VNGVQVRSKGLAEGDHVRFGTVAFRFRTKASEAREPRAPDRRLTGALEALRVLSTEMLALESERAVIRAASGFLLDQLGADRVFIAFAAERAEDGVELALIRTREGLDPKWSSAPVAHTPMKEAIRRRKTFCPSVDKQDFEVTAASVRAASLGSILVVPLQARGKGLGAIQVERVDGARGPFDEVDVLLGEVVANLISGSVETARAYRAAPRERTTPRGPLAHPL